MTEEQQPAEVTPEPPEPVPQGTLSVTRRARDHWEEGQVALIRSTVAKDCNDAELAIFLETAARHQLDPFAKEIWAVKYKGRVSIFASRDGLMSIANRHTPEGVFHVAGNGQFLGCAAGVVRDHDHFDFWQDERDDGTTKFHVDHRPRDKEGKPTHGGKDGEKRGSIVGSWSRVRRLGHDDTFFYAFRAQYDKGENTWRSHPDAMMQKCAESVALRKAFSISGVVGEGEMPRSALTETEGGGSPDLTWPEDPERTAEVKRLFNVLGWRRARVRVTLNAVGMDGGDPDFDALITRLHGEVDKMNAAESAATEEEAITDAEVVPDGA